MAQDFSGITWPGWNIAGILGHGSYGRVYEIERDVVGHMEKAALKVISIPQNDGEIEELYNDGYDSESITRRFKSHLQDIVREYSLMSEMKGHSNIVYCEDLRCVQHDDGMGWDIYIKMELLTPLPKILKNGFSEKLVIKLGLDICNALILCKSKNIVHRDIKPQNIFVSEDKNFKLGDFGIAKTAERTTSGTKTGTYKYMAPEVYNNQPYGHAADIYSLGMVLYWLLNERRTPFLPLPPQVPTATDEERARDFRFAGFPIPEPAHGSNELKRIVLKACAFSPEDRYKNAAEMRNDLLALARSGRYTAQNSPMKAPIAKEPPVRIPVPDTDETVGNFGRAQEKKAQSEETVGVFSHNAAGSNGKKGTNRSNYVTNENNEGKNKKRRSFGVLITAALVLTFFAVGFAALHFVFEKKTNEPLTANIQTTNSTELTLATEEITYAYKENDTGITIFGFKGELPAQLKIPAEIDGKPVTNIDGWIFSQCTSLSSVTIPDSVTSIGKGVFQECTSLSSVTIPNSVTCIGDCAFSQCTSLSSVTIPNNVTSIGDFAFSNCTSLSNIFIPESVTNIGDSAFSYCTSLSSITLPDCIGKIGSAVFEKCTSLSGITLPNSVTNIGDFAFNNCSSLSSVTIPDSVTSIGEHAFADCTSLSNIVIPEGVQSIDSFAFSNTGLRSVALPEGLNDVSEYAFPENCEVIGTNTSIDTNPVREETISVGDVIQFGSYPQSTSTPEPVFWIVLKQEDSRLLLLSQSALDCKPFHDRDESSTWKTSSIRKWLNDVFLNDAFSSNEKAQIVNAQVITESVTTHDSVFLLSNDEVVKYLLATADRQVKPTVYAKKQGAYIDNDGYSWWWLRSSGGNYGTYKSVVNAEGKTAQGYLTDAKDGTVRPAMWVNISGVSTSEKSETEQSNAVPAQTVDLSSISIQHYENSLRDEAGMRALLRTYDQVVLLGNAPQIQSINQLLTQDRINFLAEFSQEDKDYILLSPVYEPDKFFRTAESSVTYADDRFISICVETDGYAGGVRTINRYGLNFDLRTGKTADLLTVTGMNKTELSEALKNGIRKYLEGNYQGKIWSMEDALSMYQVDTYPFYVKEDGEIVIPFPTYSIAAGAEGCIDVPSGLRCCT